MRLCAASRRLGGGARTEACRLYSKRLVATHYSASAIDWRCKRGNYATNNRGEDMSKLELVLAALDVALLALDVALVLRAC